MNYWAILGIPKTKDLREIKRAYVRKLKKTKPDEDPEGFKKLHAAYKWATSSARDNLVTESPDIEKDVSYKQTFSDSISDTDLNLLNADFDSNHNDFISSPPQANQYSEVTPEDQELESDVKEYVHYLQEKWQSLTQHVDNATMTRETLNDLLHWKFLDNEDALLDLQFKSEFSNYVFEKISERIEKPVHKKKGISLPVFEYLNSLFHWTERRDLLEDEFGVEAVEKILNVSPVIQDKIIEDSEHDLEKDEPANQNFLIRLFIILFESVEFVCFLVYLIFRRFRKLMRKYLT